MKVPGKTALLSDGAELPPRLLDHIIAVDECHLKRLLSDYLRYYHKDRTHLGLGEGNPWATD